MKSEIEEKTIPSELQEKPKTSFWQKPKFPILFIFGLGLLIVLIVAVRLLIGIQHNNFVVQMEIAEGEQKQIETSDWITYTNEGFCFEVEYPREWEIGVEIDDAYSNDLLVVFSKDNDFEKLSFRLSVNQYGDLGVVPTQYRYEGQEITIAGIDFTPGINSFNSRHHVFGDFCVDENLNEISPIFPACDQGSRNLYFQFYLLCQGEKWEGREGGSRCGDLFNQILSTFEFTSSCPIRKK